MDTTIESKAPETKSHAHPHPERVDPIPTDHITQMATAHGPIRFLTETHVLKMRADTLLTKEPETIEWLETIQPGDVLYDVGANVGVYSLYAAATGKAAHILSFEPSPWNFAALVRSTHLNDFQTPIDAYCLAITDRTRLDTLHMQHAYFGSAQCSFGHEVDQLGAELDVAYRQATIGFAIDDFIRMFDTPIPTHIKIDVDGLDEKVAIGASDTLTNERCRTVLIEIDQARTGELDRVRALMDAAGMELTNPPPEGGWLPTNNFVFSR